MPRMAQFARGTRTASDGRSRANLLSLRFCVGWMVSHFFFARKRKRLRAPGELVFRPSQRIRAPLPRYHYNKHYRICQPLNYEQIMNKKNQKNFKKTIDISPRVCDNIITESECPERVRSEWRSVSGGAGADAHT